MCGSHQAAETGGWGLKFLKKIETRQPVASMETSPSGCCLQNVGDCSTSMNILVPAGFHSGPRNRNGGPSSGDGVLVGAATVGAGTLDVQSRYATLGQPRKHFHPSRYARDQSFELFIQVHQVGINNFLPYRQELDTQKIMSPMPLGHHLVCSDFLKHHPCPPDVPHRQSQVVYLATIFKLREAGPQRRCQLGRKLRQPHTGPDMVNPPGRTKIPAESFAEEGHGFVPPHLHASVATELARLREKAKRLSTGFSGSSSSNYVGLSNEEVGKEAASEEVAGDEEEDAKVEDQFPTSTGIGEVRGDQKVSRQCFITEMKTSPTMKPSTNVLYVVISGRESVILVEIWMPSFRTINFDKENNEADLRFNLDLLSERREHAGVCQTAYKYKVAKYSNKRVKCMLFLPGDLVLREVTLSIMELNAGKLGLTWECPYKVIKVGMKDADLLFAQVEALAKEREASPSTAFLYLSEDWNSLIVGVVARASFLLISSISFSCLSKETSCSSFNFFSSFLAHYFSASSSIPLPSRSLATFWAWVISAPPLPAESLPHLASFLRDHGGILWSPYRGLACPTSPYLESFSATIGFSMAKASSPRTTLGLAKVPSSGATNVGTSQVTTWPDVALDLAGAFIAGPFLLLSGSGIDSFFLASAACFPFFEGKMVGVSSQTRFTPIWTPFSPVGVTPFLGLPFALANWASFFMSIFFDIAA
ncbi:hypothetical protein Acr_08g0013760 [Actinidia rufa]|uniref:Uncharacterized protein n=1 Tax=Actinidia rufa TaxID=165716 RepID=A0A7J0F2S2_9ERIC|nr:hypothetical protein Acr_08g0013760 [Actinidia rufa]